MMTDVEKAAYRMVTGGSFSFGTHRINGEDREIEIEIRPLDFESEKKIMILLAELIKKSIPEKQEETSVTSSTPIANIFEQIQKVLAGSLNLEWVDYIPKMTLIISDSYDTGLDIKAVKKLSIPQMIELITRQIQTDKESSKVASDFFTSIVKKVPGLTQITALIQAVNQLMETTNYQNIV